MKAEIKGNKLIIEIDMKAELKPSASGRSIVVASSGGFKATDAKVKGQPVSVSVNATIEPPQQAAA